LFEFGDALLIEGALDVVIGGAGKVGQVALAGALQLEVGEE
jgi:hypothetical protein